MSNSNGLYMFSFVLLLNHPSIFSFSPLVPWSAAHLCCLCPGSLRWGAVKAADCHHPVEPYELPAERPHLHLWNRKHKRFKCIQLWQWNKGNCRWYSWGGDSPHANTIPQVTIQGQWVTWEETRMMLPLKGESGTKMKPQYSCCLVSLDHFI